MASTTRLPDGLKAEAVAYAASLGLSFNGLVAVALRDYLDKRRVAPELVGRADPVPVQAAKVVEVAPPANRRGPCPCGSGKRYNRCHGLVG